MKIKEYTQNIQQSERQVSIEYPGEILCITVRPVGGKVSSAMTFNTQPQGMAAVLVFAMVRFSDR